MTMQEWDTELDKVLDPGWFDNIVGHIEQAGGSVDNLTERRRQCYIRLIKGNNYGSRNLWRKWYEEDFGEVCPVV